MNTLLILLPSFPDFWNKNSDIVFCLFDLCVTLEECLNMELNEIHTDIQLCNLIQTRKIKNFNTCSLCVLQALFQTQVLLVSYYGRENITKGRIKFL